MKEIVAYETIDGKKFFIKSEAEKHELDFINRKDICLEKYKAYNYFIEKLNRYAKIESNVSKNIILFMVCSLTDFKLLDIFDRLIHNFNCPSDIDIYNMDKNFKDSDASQETKDMIDSGLKKLSHINPKIFFYKPYDLFELYSSFDCVKIWDDLYKVSKDERLRKMDKISSKFGRIYYGNNIVIDCSKEYWDDESKTIKKINSTID